MLWLCLLHVCQTSSRGMLIMRLPICLAGPLRCPWVKVILQLHISSSKKPTTSKKVIFWWNSWKTSHMWTPITYATTPSGSWLNFGTGCWIWGSSSCTALLLLSSVVSDSFQPYGLQPARLLCPWDSPGKNTGVGCHFLLQGIFLTQGSNPHLLHCRRIFFVTELPGKPTLLYECLSSSVFRLPPGLCQPVLSTVIDLAHLYPLP